MFSSFYHFFRISFDGFCTITYWFIKIVSALRIRRYLPCGSRRPLDNPNPCGSGSPTLTDTDLWRGVSALQRAGRQLPLHADPLALVGQLEVTPAVQQHVTRVQVFDNDVPAH